jgi:hypothetical protein
MRGATMRRAYGYCVNLNQQAVGAAQRFKVNCAATVRCYADWSHDGASYEPDPPYRWHKSAPPTLLFRSTIINPSPASG